MVPLMLALALAGCGADRTGPGGISANCGLAGSSRGNVTGAVSTSLTGCALFTVSTTASGSSTAIVLAAGTAATPTHTLTLGRANGARLAVGSYTIGTGANQLVGSFTFDASTGDRQFTLTSGTINITASSASSLTGTYTSLTGFESATPANTISITGSFTARCTATSSTTC